MQQAQSTATPDDLRLAFERLTRNDHAKWIVVKNNMDHGPFTAREVIQWIVDAEALPEHTLVDIEKNERMSFSDATDFHPFLIQQQFTLKERASKEAIKTADQREQRASWIKGAVAGGLLLITLTVTAVFFVTRSEKTKDTSATSSLAELYETGERRIEGQVGIIDIPEDGYGGKGARAAALAAMPKGSGASYESAMRRVVNLGSAKGDGDQSQLSETVISSIMSRNARRLMPCVASELRSGQSIGQVGVDLAILGSGKVAGVSVRQGSGNFKKCVAAKVRAIRFPRFGAPRMGARYSFAVD